MQRRQFLQALLGAPAALSCARRVPIEGPVRLPLGERVAVIGAGVAGLAAAHALSQKGVAVTVLEGRDRIGGRVHTSRAWPGLPMELGASWIHGLRRNPLRALARELGSPLFETDYDDKSLFAADGRRLSAGEQRALYRGLDRALDESYSLRGDRQADELPDISLAEALSSYLAGLSAPEQTALRFALIGELEHEYGVDLSSLSLYSWDEGDAFGGPDALWLGGYDALPRALAEGLDLRLADPVTQVSVEGEQVRITTRAGALTVDRAIVTLPLGVLKRGAVSFSPALPAEKQRAIDALGVGLLDKIILRFPRQFWGDELFSGYLGEPPGEGVELLHLHQAVGAPVLMCFNAGSVASAYQALPEADAVARVMEILRRLYGADIPDPEAQLLTRWAEDPFAFGSYSCPVVGALPSHHDALAAPVGERLFFAGEATNATYYATVHGAYLSGLREAGRWGD